MSTENHTPSLEQMKTRTADFPPLLEMEMQTRNTYAGQFTETSQVPLQGLICTSLCSFCSVSIHPTVNVKAEYVSVVCLPITEKNIFIYGKTT